MSPFLYCCFCLFCV